MRRRVVASASAALALAAGVVWFAINDSENRTQQRAVVGQASQVISAMVQADTLSRIDAPQHPGRVYRALSQHDRTTLVLGSVLGMQAAALILTDVPFVTPQDTKQTTEMIKNRNAATAFLLLFPHGDEKVPQTADIVNRLESFYLDSENDDVPIPKAIERMWIQLAKEDRVEQPPKASSDKGIIDVLNGMSEKPGLVQ